MKSDLPQADASCTHRQSYVVNTVAAHETAEAGNNPGAHRQRTPAHPARSHEPIDQNPQPTRQPPARLPRGIKIRL